jgi:hypothetical protein
MPPRMSAFWGKADIAIGKSVQPRSVDMNDAVPNPNPASATQRFHRASIDRADLYSGPLLRNLPTRPQLHRLNVPDSVESCGISILQPLEAFSFLREGDRVLQRLSGPLGFKQNVHLVNIELVGSCGLLRGKRHRNSRIEVRSFCHLT